MVDAWLSLPDDLQAPARARGMLADKTQALAAAQRDDLLVLVTELVTNAVIHGRPDVVLHLIVGSDLVRGEVYDYGDTFSLAGRQSVSINESSGRGLAIVDTLATRWGTTIATPDRGKAVWFELSLLDAS
jgi:anti-sigma regulatory factor (Ser/Thr protein kinase)